MIIDDLPAIDTKLPDDKIASVHDYFGKSLIFEAICETPNLHMVFNAYVSADASQRRQCSHDERMFYDACLGTALRSVVDTFRATRLHLNNEQRRSIFHEMETTTPTPTLKGNTSCH